MTDEEFDAWLFALDATALCESFLDCEEYLVVPSRTLGDNDE
jgi:hypothetical protein